MTEDAAGLYVHLPYCRSRCGYCAFVVTTDESGRTEYLAALAREAEIVSSETSGRKFDSLYIGGGTPSLVPAGDLSALVSELRKRFALEDAAEVTLEANPEDVTAGKCDAWKSSGVNRLSLGVQSLEDAELAAVGRRHDAAGARRALDRLVESELSVSADLILGLPDQSAASFRRNVEGIGASGVEHLSIYLLETEKSRSIEEDRRAHPGRYLSDDEQADAWLEAGESLAARGFLHYEISNWARPGREARHNVKYWTRTPTLGLGVSAHELWDGRRRANVSAIVPYVTTLSEGRRPLALDQPVGEAEAARERIVLGLRLSDGVPAGEIEAWIESEGDALLAGDYRAWFEAGLLSRENDGRVRFTERGFLLSNEILCRFV
ncbi:MAG TPA: radical SAM family heme chaperone HemW [Thermoanaerobaculia bacterium]|nr:radical SAM family heme chaperone HemW [Thermoanaerobaculia bacterium]